MTTKHTPATPLPWRVPITYKPSDGLELLGADDFCVTSFDTEECPQTTGDALYIAHACNSYPKLIDFVRSRAGRTDADALLRSLGEA